MRRKKTLRFWFIKVLFFYFLFLCFWNLPKLTVFAASTANPSASVSTKQLLNFLSSLSGKNEKKVVSGQYVGSPWNFSSGYDSYITSIANLTGKTVGLISGDLAFGEWGKGTDNFEKIKEHWKKGGIISFSWHMYNPWTGNGLNWTGGSEGDLTVIGSFSDLYANSSTAAYKNWHADLDKKAQWLKEMQDAGITVLLRPFHEMNGNWMWWANRDQMQFKKLWQELFNYFTFTKGLNNLLWVYAPNRVNDGSGYKAADYYYPGNDFVDIVGLDYYYFECRQSSCNEGVLSNIGQNGYNDLVLLGKPFALTEFGPGSGGSEPPANFFDYQLLINAIKKYAPQTVYFMAWNKNYAMINQINAAGLLRDSWVINAGEMTATVPQISFVLIQPATLKIEMNRGAFGLSALAYDENNVPLWSGVTYEWGMSSANSVGKLGRLSGVISTFTPLKPGKGEIYVKAVYNGTTVLKTMPVEVVKHCRPLGDVDCNGKINALDFSFLLSKFNQSNADADLDDSDLVNFHDANILMINF